MLILGVDVGLNGALAFLHDGQLVNVEDLPLVDVKHGAKTRKELSAALLHDRLVHTDVRIHKAVLENVNAFGMGRTSAYRFGQNVGTILGVLCACGVRIEGVSPAKWKRDMGLTADKKLSRAMAIQLWPDQSHYFARAKDDGRAESALLAEWAWRQAWPSGRC